MRWAGPLPCGMALGSAAAALWDGPGSAALRGGAAGRETRRLTAGRRRKLGPQPPCQEPPGLTQGSCRGGCCWRASRCRPHCPAAGALFPHPQGTSELPEECSFLPFQSTYRLLTVQRRLSEVGSVKIMTKPLPSRAMRSDPSPGMVPFLKHWTEILPLS